MAVRKRTMKGRDVTKSLEFKIACAFEKAVIEQIIDKNIYICALAGCHAIHSL